MKVIISGASGFLGKALSRELAEHGHLVTALVRRPVREDAEAEWHPEKRELDRDVLAGADAIVNLSGAGIGDKRWTTEYKRILRESRMQSTGTLAHTLAEMGSESRPTTFVSASAVGFYGERGDQPLPESATVGTGFLADLARDWEAATQPAAAAGVRVATLRTGLPLAASGGLLKRLMPIFKAGIGGTLGSGQQYQSWISLADEVGAIRHILETDAISGPVNLAGPEPVRNQQFTKALGRTLHRPTLVRAPAFAMRLVLGQLADEGALASQRMIPQVLIEHNYRFQHPDLQSALDWAVQH